MLKLDSNIPFVEKVLAFANHQVSIDSCVELLQFYEEKWNVRHLAPGLEIYVKDFTIKTKSPEKFVHIIDLPNDEQLWQQYVFKNYYGFLSDTHLILDTLCYSDKLDIIFSNTYSYQATARAWAEMYAGWANQTRWLGRKSWKDVDFYSHIPHMIEDFGVWADAGYKIIEVKTKQNP